MTVRLGDVTFPDWASLQYEGGFTDTFIFHINALNGLPPFGYRPLLQRLVAELVRKRPGASLWIRVDSPGEWYLMEVKRSMRRGFAIPFVVTRLGEEPDFRKFSFRPRLFSPSRPPPPAIDDGLSHFSQEELQCLQVLTRIRKGSDAEIASLTRLPDTIAHDVLLGLQENNFTIFKLGERLQKDKSKPKEKDPYPMWHPTRSGISIALRSWGASKGKDFSGVKELNSHLIGTPHRTVSRRWLAWLRAAYPRAEIWACWSETKLPGISVYPDALAWGRIQGYETLFWLEVGDEHKSRKEIEENTRQRLKSAFRFCQRTGARLVYAQISPRWVQEVVSVALGPLPPNAAAVIENKGRFGELPTVEWGQISNW